MINKLYNYKSGYRYNVALDATKGREIQLILFKWGLYLLFWQLQQENDYYYEICFKSRKHCTKLLRDCMILANIPKLSLLINNSQQWPRAFYLRCALCLTHYRVSWFSYMISKSETKKTSEKVTFNIQKSFLCQSVCVVNKCSTCYFTKELVSNQALFA